MFNKVKKWFKSRTINTAMVIALLGVVELNFNMLQEILGEWYGVSFILLSLVMAMLRGITTQPLNEK